MSHADRLTGEFDFIDWIRRLVDADPRVPVGIGDDTAVVQIAPGHEVLVTTDMLLEGVHFDLSRPSARQVGRKALGVNLSDIAAMAGTPLAAVVAVGIPDRLGRADAEQLLRGMHDLAAEFGVAIFGGDTNRSRGDLV